MGVITFYVHIRCVFPKLFIYVLIIIMLKNSCFHVLSQTLNLHVGIPFEFEAVCSTLTHPVDVSFVFGVSIQKAAAGLVESIPVVTLLLTRTGNRMAFGAAENVKNLIPGAKLFLKFGTCCATATENIRRGDVAILGGSADSPCLYDVDENIEFSVVSPGYCHDLLLWQAAASSTLVDPRMRIHRLPLFSGSKQFLPGTFPKKIQPASGEMEAAGIWDSVSLTKNKELLFGSVNLISELFYMSEDQVEKFHDPKEKLGLLTSILPPVLKNLVIFLKNRSFFA